MDLIIDHVFFFRSHAVCRVLSIQLFYLPFFPGLFVNIFPCGSSSAYFSQMPAVLMSAEQMLLSPPQPQPPPPPPSPAHSPIPLLPPLSFGDEWQQQPIPTLSAEDRASILQLTRLSTQLPDQFVLSLSPVSDCSLSPRLLTTPQRPQLRLTPTLSISPSLSTPPALSPLRTDLVTPLDATPPVPSPQRPLLSLQPPLSLLPPLTQPAVLASNSDTVVESIVDALTISLGFDGIQVALGATHSPPVPSFAHSVSVSVSGGDTSASVTSSPAVEPSAEVLSPEPGAVDACDGDDFEDFLALCILPPSADADVAAAATTSDPVDKTRQKRAQQLLRVKRWRHKLRLRKRQQKQQQQQQQQQRPKAKSPCKRLRNIGKVGELGLSDDQWVKRKRSIISAPITRVPACASFGVSLFIASGAASSDVSKRPASFLSSNASRYLNQFECGLRDNSVTIFEKTKHTLDIVVFKRDGSISLSAPQRDQGKRTVYIVRTDKGIFYPITNLKGLNFTDNRALC